MKHLRLEEFVVIVFGGLFIFGLILFYTCSVYIAGVHTLRLTPMKADILKVRSEQKMVSGHSVGYVPEILVQYKIEESKFKKWIRPIEGKSFSKDAASEILTRYPQGSEVVIFIDSEDHSYAVIDRTIGDGNYAFSLFISVLAMAWVSALFVVVRKVKVRKLDKNWSADNDTTEENLPLYVEYPISRIGIFLTWGLLAVWILFVVFILWHYKYFHPGDFPLILKFACVIVSIGMAVHVGYGIYIMRLRHLSRDN